MKRFRARQVAALAVAIVMVQTPAFAHHPMGGEMPTTFLQGFLSGLGHPVIGLDHLAAIVGVGALAAIAGRGLAPVLAFSVAMIAGVGVHLVGIDIPAGELLAVLTTVALGVLVLLRQGLSVPILAAVFAATGLVHGFALGETVVGAEPSPVIAYLAGLLIIQSAIASAAFVGISRFMSWRPATYALGALVAVVGVLS